jgi:hypothetical protein
MVTPNASGIMPRRFHKGGMILTPGNKKWRTTITTMAINKYVVGITFNVIKLRGPVALV